MSQSHARWFLPPTPTLGRAPVIQRIIQVYPDLSKTAKLFWTRTTRRAPDWGIYHKLKQAEMRVMALHPSLNHALNSTIESIQSKESKSNSPSGRDKVKPQTHQSSKTPGGPAGQALKALTEAETIARGVAAMDLIMVEAMGLAFDGSVPFRDDPNAYLLLPRERPDGLPPFGLYICGDILHIFVSEQDIVPVAAFIGPGASRFLEEVCEVQVLWHLLTARSLALGGTAQAVEATGVPRDHGFVVWQWHPGGLLGAAGYSRDFGVHSTLVLSETSPETTWLAAANFMDQAQAYAHPAPEAVWKMLQVGGSAPVRDAGAVPARQPAPVIGSGASRIPESAPNLGSNPGQIPSQTTTGGPSRAAEFDRPYKGASGGREHSTTSNADSTPIEPSAPPQHRPGTAPAPAEHRASTASAPADAKAADVAKLKQQMELALAIGNPAKVAAIQQRLDALTAAD